MQQFFLCGDNRTCFDILHSTEEPWRYVRMSSQSCNIIKETPLPRNIISWSERNHPNPLFRTGKSLRHRLKIVLLGIGNSLACHASVLCWYSSNHLLASLLVSLSFVWYRACRTDKSFVAVSVASAMMVSGPQAPKPVKFSMQLNSGLTCHALQAGRQTKMNNLTTLLTECSAYDTLLCGQIP